MFEYTYADPTPRLDEQRTSLDSLRRRHGDDRLRRDE
jgi:pyruvate dehydrogenase E1 component alpha subunit